MTTRPLHGSRGGLALCALCAQLATACAPEASIEAHQPDAGHADATPFDAIATDALATSDAAAPDSAQGVDASVIDTASVADASAPDQAAPDRTAQDTADPADAASPLDASSAHDAEADAGPPAGQDNDGDGLDDAWEWAAGNSSLLDWQRADSDGDGTPDGAEDPDGDGLDNLQELAAGRFVRPAGSPAPHPLRRDLLVELDSMEGRALSVDVLALARRVFAALPLTNADGSSGVQLQLIVDEQDLPAVAFDGSFSQRWAYLAAHGPALDDGLSPPLPLDRLVHVAVVTSRSDDTARGGDTVAHASDVEQAGVFIYHDAIAALHPACGRSIEPVLPDITVDEALASTLTHELGHVLQLGHDTSAGGSVNYYNLMSLPQNCLQAQMRVHGDGNADPALGATSGVAEPRFSQAATALLHFEHQISVDVSDFDQSGGYEM